MDRIANALQTHIYSHLLMNESSYLFLIFLACRDLFSEGEYCAALGVTTCEEWKWVSKIHHLSDMNHKADRCKKWHATPTHLKTQLKNFGGGKKTDANIVACIKLYVLEHVCCYNSTDYVRL